MNKYLIQIFLNIKRGDFTMECEVCESEVTEDKIKHIKIKGKIKKVCEGCITAIKGFA